MTLLLLRFLVLGFNLNALFANKFEDVKVIEDFGAGVKNLHNSAGRHET